jgi:riboflavin biosynthesis pyrimidine reductase
VATARLLLPEPRTLTDRLAFEEAYRVPDRRHVRVNFVTSLDGVVEVEGRSGQLGGPADRDAFMAMRAVADAVLVGAGTVRAEDYGPIRLDEETRSRRASRGQTPLPALAVVSASGRLDPSARLFSGKEAGSRPIVLTTEAGARPELEGVADVVRCGAEQVDLDRALAALAERGLDRILCEGGPSLAGDLLRAERVDELCLTVSPLLVGSGASLSRICPPGPPLKLEVVSLAEGDGLLLARYRVLR